METQYRCVMSKHLAATSAFEIKCWVMIRLRWIFCGFVELRDGETFKLEMEFKRLFAKTEMKNQNEGS